MDRHRTHDHDHAATLVSTSGAPALLSRVSWGAIFAGAVIALGTMILLGMMGSAIGFGSIDPGTGNPFSGIGIGAAIWWIITSVVALGIGGFVAGRLSGIPDKSSSSAHGAAVWGVVTIFTLWFAASAVGSVFNTATGALTGAARVAGNVAGTAAQTATAPNSPVDVNVTQGQIEAAAQDVVQEVRQQAQQIDPQALEAQAIAVADDATDALSTAAWYAFFASLLGLAAAAFAAGAGAPKHTFVVGNEKVHTTETDVRTTHTTA